MVKPVLNSQFFKEHSINADFWKKNQDLHTWSNQLFPIYEWDNLLFVATSDDHHFADLNAIESKIKKKLILVLADKNLMQLTWGQFNSEELTPQNNMNVNLDTVDFFKDLNSDSQLEKPIPDLALKPEQDSLGSDPKIESDHPLLPNLDQVTAITKVDLSSLKAEEKSDSIQVSVLQKDNSNNSISTLGTDSQLTDVLDKLNAHFSQSMMLLIQDESVTPYKWNQGYKPQSNDIPSISLLELTPFRVIFRTQKSFCGLVYESDANKKFNDFWRASTEQNYMVAAPIIVEDKLIGIIACQEPTKMDDKENLELVESSANEIKTYLEKNIKTKAA